MVCSLVKVIGFFYMQQKPGVVMTPMKLWHCVTLHFQKWNPIETRVVN